MPWPSRGVFRVSATLVALMTALQESQLQNLNCGDRDSVGLFQQRPTAGWGTVQEILDPTYAAEAFFGGAKAAEPAWAGGHQWLAGS